MLGLALTVFGLTFAVDPIELPNDVEEIQTRQFAMPLSFDPVRARNIQRVRLFVSQDQGKTWKHDKDYQPGDKQATFTAERDGLYWFALQVEFKNGQSEPAKLENLTPAMKVYVNTERKALKPQKTNEELQREIEELKRTVEQLQKRIKELETERGAK